MPRLGPHAAESCIRELALDAPVQLIVFDLLVRSGASPLGLRNGSSTTSPGLDAKVTGATLVIVKLDRLSRNAAFLLTLRDSGVRFAAVDLPEANDLTVGIMALVAQAEREAISRRTKEALSVAGSRGGEARQPEWSRGAQAGWQRRWGAARGDCPQRRPTRAGSGVSGSGHPGGWRNEPPRDCGGAECPRHAHPSGRAVARLDGNQPARPTAGGTVRQSRMMPLVEATANVLVGLIVAVATQIVVFPVFGLQASLGQNVLLALVFTGVSIVRSYALRRMFEAIRE
jgi:hypothetical protein